MPAGKFPVRSKDGRWFLVDLRDGIYTNLYFLGMYEPHVTAAVRRVLREGDLAVDVGANFGWYTTLFAEIVGPLGAVHGLEPVSWIYRQLEGNLWLNGTPPWVTIRQLALSDRREEVQLHVFAGLPHGHSSISDLGRTDFSIHRAPAVPLDDYLEEEHAAMPALVKLDVEGAEMKVLRGAAGLLASPRPPMWIVEINEETSAWFRYSPEDLLSVFSGRGYRFVVLRRQPVALRTGVRYQHGDNVLCYIPDLHGGRIDRLGVA